MRIVHAVRSDSFAGVERYVIDVASRLSGLGHEVVVIGGDLRGVRAVVPAGVTHHPAATTRQVALALARVGRPDVVHAHMTAAELAAVVSRPAHRAPVVATRHFAAQRGGNAVRRRVAAAVARGLAGEISISEFVAARTGPGSSVLHNGVPDRPAGEHGERTVLVCQRLEQEKETVTALHAFARSGVQDYGWCLQVVGRGSERPALEALAVSLGVDAVFLGFVDDPLPLMAAAGVLLAPARAEPFGLAVVEAMATGLPVLAAAGGAHTETVGDLATLFPVGDAVACAQLLRRLCTDDAWRRRVGDQQRARQREQFSLAGHVAALEEHYRRLACRR